MHVCFRAAQAFFVMVARSGADCQMDGAADGVDPSKVKQEERSDAGEREVPKRRAEEGVQLTAAVAASQKGAVADKAVRLGTQKPCDADAEGDSYSDSSDPSVTPPHKSKKPLERKRGAL